MRSTSSIWSPQDITGFKAVIGSWKIIDMRTQRSARRRSALAPRMFSPSSRISPPVALSSLGESPMTACAITDLPEPDSPTRQTISPRPTVRLTSATAWARSLPRGSAMLNARMSRTALTGLPSCHCVTSSPGEAYFSIRRSLRAAGRERSCPLGHLGIEHVAQAVAQYVHRQHRERQEDPREKHVVRELLELHPALGHDVAPGGNVGRQA